MSGFCLVVGGSFSVVSLVSQMTIWRPNWDRLCSV